VNQFFKPLSVSKHPADATSHATKGGMLSDSYFAHSNVPQGNHGFPHV